MAGPDNPRTDGAPPNHIHIEKKKVNWLAWILLALGILALLYWLMRDREPAVSVAAPVAATDVVGTTPNAAGATALATTAGLGTYLAGTDAAPRTFTFETLNFDTARSDIRPADRAEVTSIAGVLKQYPGTRVRIAGYADARGSDEANTTLGKARADSVKAALVGQGIDAGRIETASGGTTDPIASNASASGRAENRRTELVVVQR